MNIESNAIRGDFMHSIVDTTIQEIHDNLVTVFGPYATDAYITKNQQPYYTRDGKEVLASMTFNNPLCMYILKIIYQAVYDQGKRVGDGTTTLAVLYTNLFRIIRETNYCYTRDEWNAAIKELVEAIKAKAVPMDDEKLKSVLLTCTQDTELASKIYVNLRDAIMNQAYIIINKSNIDTDFQMTVHNSPLIKVTKQFSIRPVKQVEDRCVVLHCNGMLDIAHAEVLLTLMNNTPGYFNEDNKFVPMPKTVILLCNGITEATRRTTKEVIRILNQQSIDVTQYNNIAIYTLTDYRSYSPEQLEDISTIFTDEDGIGGLVNQLTFESLLYQAINNDPNLDIPELKTFDCDLHHIDKIRNIFKNDCFQIEFDDIAGMRIHKPFGPIAQARYDDLRKQIDEEKSEVKKIALNKRLRTMYGQFIEVEVGSALMKDSQRKYELILDAVLSTSEGVESGVLDANSLLVTAATLYDMINALLNKNDFGDAIKLNIYQDLYSAIVDTVLDMIANFWNIDDWSNNPIKEFSNWIKDKDLTKFDLTRPVFSQVLPDDSIQLVPDNSYTTIQMADGTEVQIKNQLVEPVSIITTMLTNSTLIFELAKAKTFHIDSFIGNYMEQINYKEDDSFLI